MTKLQKMQYKSQIYAMDFREGGGDTMLYVKKMNCGKILFSLWQEGKDSLAQNF